MDETIWLEPVFIENIKDASLWPYGEIIVPAYRLFEESLPLSLLATAVAGSVIGGLTSWLFGWWVSRVRERRTDFLSDTVYHRMAWVARRVGPFAVCFYWVPCGGLLPVLAGFLRVPPIGIATGMAVGRLIVEYNR